MKVTLASVGKLKEPAFRSLADDYIKRIRRYTTFAEVETKDAPALGRLHTSSATVVALEVWGRQVKSERFAKDLERWGSTGKGEIVFLIGAADGIPGKVSENADVHLSLSAMTLPHRLARIILLEQIYRGLSILRGEPYAREG